MHHDDEDVADHDDIIVDDDDDDQGNSLHCMACPSLAHGLHGEGGEPVGDHAADDQEGKGDWLEDVDARLHAQAHDKGAVEGQGHQSSGANGEALSDGSRGVARGVQGVSATSHLGAELCHLSDASGVVRDGAKAIDGQAAGQRGKHAQGGQRDAIEVAELEGYVDGRGEHKDWDDAALVAQSQALDDVHCGAELAGASELSRGHVAVRSEVLCDQADDEATDAAHSGADEALVRAAADLGRTAVLREADTLQAELVREQDSSEVVDDRQHQNGSEHHLHLQHGLDVLLLLDGRDVRGDKTAEDADHDAGSRDGQGEEHGVPASLGKRVVGSLHGRGRDDQRSAGALGEGAEEVRAHTGDIAHVVTDVVRDGGGVVGIVLIKAGHDLAHQVGADICGLGVDAAANTAEHGNGAAAQAIAGRAVEKDLPVVRLRVDGAVEGQQEPQDEHAQGAERVAHDAAAAECDVEAQGVGCRVIFKGSERLMTR